MSKIQTLIGSISLELRQIQAYSNTLAVLSDHADNLSLEDRKDAWEDAQFLQLQLGTELVGLKHSLDLLFEEIAKGGVASKIETL